MNVFSFAHNNNYPKPREQNRYKQESKSLIVLTFRLLRLSSSSLDKAYRIIIKKSFNFEVIINKKAFDHFNKDNLFSGKEYAFRSARSTADVLPLLIESVQKETINISLGQSN